MKKIAVFHPSSELYGADRIMVLSLKALNEYLPVIYLPSNGPLVHLIKKEIPWAIVNICPNMPLFYRDLKQPKNALKFAKNMRSFSSFLELEFSLHVFDKIYINTLACSPILWLLRREKTFKIVHVHEILDRPEIARKITNRIILKHADKIICVSHPVAENISNQQIDKIKIVNNGIPIIDVRDAEADNMKIQFYLFGRIKPEKGQWYLLEAIKQLKKHELKHVHFNLIGSPLTGKEQLLDELLTEIKVNGLSEYISHKSFVADISSELSKADVCLVPSQMKDPFPTTVLEAMSAKKPVIATNHGGAVEAIHHGINGFLISPNNANELTTAIRAFIENRQRIKSMGEKGFLLYKNQFTLEKFMERFTKAVA